MLSEKFVYVLNYFKINETAHKNNARENSLQQNKKVVLTTATYRKYPNLVRTQVEIISNPNYLVSILFERLFSRRLI